MLDDPYDGVSAIIKNATAEAAVLTLQLDGWSDINCASIVNVALYAGRPVVLKSTDPGINRHDAKFIADAVLQTVHGLGNDAIKVRTVITDQPTVMTAAWKFI